MVKIESYWNVSSWFGLRKVVPNSNERVKRGLLLFSAFVSMNNYLPCVFLLPVLLITPIINFLNYIYFNHHSERFFLCFHIVVLKLIILLHGDESCTESQFSSNFVDLDFFSINYRSLSFYFHSFNHTGNLACLEIKVALNHIFSGPLTQYSLGHGQGGDGGGGGCHGERSSGSFIN